MAGVQACAEVQLIVEVDCKVGQRTKPSMVVVRRSDEIGSFALPVFIDIEAIGAKFKELMSVPKRLQIERPVCQP